MATVSAEGSAPQGAHVRYPAFVDRTHMHILCERAATQGRSIEEMVLKAIEDFLALPRNENDRVQREIAIPTTQWMALRHSASELGITEGAFVRLAVLTSLSR